MGLFSSSHCLFMCGGIASAFSSPSNTQSQLYLKVILFHLGRLTCYSSLGLIAGFFMVAIGNYIDSIGFILRHLAGALLILIGFYLLGRGKLLKQVELKLGFIWQHIQPFVKRSYHSAHPSQGFLLGIAWGFLPCGIIYSTLLWAITTTQNSQAAIVMFAFGLGTLPAFLSLFFFQKTLTAFFTAKAVRVVVASLFIVFGVWTLLPLVLPTIAWQHPFC